MGVTTKAMSPTQKEQYEEALINAFDQSLGGDFIESISIDNSSTANVTANVTFEWEENNGLLNKLNSLLIGKDKSLFAGIVNEKVAKEGLDEITIYVVVAPSIVGTFIPHSSSDIAESSSSPVASPTVPATSSSSSISMYSTYFSIFGLVFSLL